MIWWCPCARCDRHLVAWLLVRRIVSVVTTRRLQNASARAAPADTHWSCPTAAAPAFAAAPPSLHRHHPSPKSRQKTLGRKLEGGASWQQSRRRSSRWHWRRCWWWWWRWPTALCSAHTTKRPSTTRSPCRRTILSVSPVHVAPPSPLPLRMRLSPTLSARGCERRRGGSTAHHRHHMRYIILSIHTWTNYLGSMTQTAEWSRSSSSRSQWTSHVKDYKSWKNDIWAQKVIVTGISVINSFCTNILIIDMCWWCWTVWPGFCQIGLSLFRPHMLRTFATPFLHD